MQPYYDDGKGIQIFLGDCRDVLPTLATGSIDLVLTDPPYGHNNNNGDLIHRREAALGHGPVQASRPIANDGIDANDLVRWMFGEVARLLKPGCCCCCCCGGGGPDPQFARWSLWLGEVLNFKQMLIWDKGGLGMGWHYRRSYETILVGEKPGAACHWFGGNAASNVLRYGKIIPQSDDHPTPKPVSLMQHMIGLHSESGDVVVDPFLGAGTTLVAAKAMGRKAIGCEVDEHWCQVAARRLEQSVLPLEVA